MRASSMPCFFSHVSRKCRSWCGETFRSSPACSVQIPVRGLGRSLVQALASRVCLHLHTYVYLVMHVFSLLLDVLATSRLSDRQKDIEILLLRQQLRILQRKVSRSPSIPIWEKGILAILAVQLRRYSEGTGHRLDEALLLFKPDTVLDNCGGTANWPGVSGPFDETEGAADHLLQPSRKN